MMPLRITTRAHRIAAERRHNHQARQALQRAHDTAEHGPAPPDDPPPF